MSCLQILIALAPLWIILLGVSCTCAYLIFVRKVIE